MNEYKLKAKDGEEFIVYEGNGNFHKSLSELPKGVYCASAEEFAGARLLIPKDHPLWTWGVWAAENYNYFSNGDIIIASRDYNPILRNAEKAIDAHYAGREFYLDSKAVDELRSIAKPNVSDAIKSGALLVPRKDVKQSFLTKNLVNEAVPYFLFRENAKAYGQMLSENNNPELLQDVIDQNDVKQPLGRALWVHCIDYGSALNVYNYDLLDIKDYGRDISIGRVCGMRLVEPAKQVAPAGGTIDERVENQLPYKTHTCKKFID